MLSLSRAAGNISAIARHGAPFLTRNNPLPLESEDPVQDSTGNLNRRFAAAKPWEEFKSRHLIGQNHVPGAVHKESNRTGGSF